MIWLLHRALTSIGCDQAKMLDGIRRRRSFRPAGPGAPGRQPGAKAARLKAQAGSSLLNRSSGSLL